MLLAELCQEGPHVAGGRQLDGGPRPPTSVHLRLAPKVAVPSWRHCTVLRATNYLCLTMVTYRKCASTDS